MAIHVALHHRTHYQYDRPVALGPQIVRLRPAPHARTRILSYSLRILPEKHFINWQQDSQSNFLARLVFNESACEFLVEVDLVAEMAVLNPFDFFLEPAAEKFPFAYDPALDHELAPFFLKAPATPRFAAYLEKLRRELSIGSSRGNEALTETKREVRLLTSAPAEKDDRPRTNDFLVELNRRVWKDIKYLIRLEPGVQSPEETLTRRSGSCRDSAWLLCQLFRHLGVASRFVSGYLIQLTADVKSLDGPSGPAKDFTDLHAWCDVYLPGAGWIGLDPTSGLLAGEGHIPLACTPEPSSAAPITGEVEACEVKFAHEMNVTRIHESPRATKPYTEEQWREIETLGHRIDTELTQHDVRLTMGGEPTFISIDNMDGEEWNFTAVGPEKHRLSGVLIRRLKDKFAPGSLLHYGQGKWYPGESLPRWAFGCYWRNDGQPIWENDRLIADEQTKYGHTAEHSARFIAELAARLGVDPKWIMPGYEDSFYHLWKERRLPMNVDPLQANLKDDEERARLAKILAQGLDSVVGHALPIQRSRNDYSSGWVSGPWFLRAERLFLFPGDSPMGLRLPLDSLPWVSQSDYPYLNEPDPTVEHPPLPARKEFRGRYLQGAALDQRAAREAALHRRRNQSAEEVRKAELLEDTARVPQRGESAAWIVRTALCVEPREGRLHVFMPPVPTLEDFLELITAVEDTAAHVQTPVVIEGYTPPHDYRVNHLKVTPDPGVIEVNLQPAHNWDELVHNTTVLYEEARQSRLGTEKFMIDGRHVGTGGGNHVVIGGPTPADSPLLRRPDLLRSLLGYWQNHPSLSFLFSGLFIGPTSQHPRVDEARNDSLYELEVAFKELDRQLAKVGQASRLPSGSFRVAQTASGAGETPVLPWLVDRLFRNLLIDTTGNTHRAEFCIDKLYSPDRSSGRLGLVELRAFEMPPHARMSLTQQLLLRSLLARFWTHPYERSLVRWGTQLHDRFMLPHFVEQDFRDVIEDLQDHGYPLKPAWFAPHFEFRFPLYGDVTQRGVNVEIRQALEPWHVLGEQGAAGAAVRHVDSSLERLQVKVRGLIDSRHVIACNRRAVPLHPTGTEGEYVAGVRFRAWQPPECLQPTIGVHSPLMFDIVDSWNGRSLGGCTYHVAHPGGRHYSTFPINAYEAESRRLARFFRLGHTPGPISVAPPERNSDFPLTLDLRHA
ncbi:MAG: transglutaminase family protein [Verrucomicrobia bacterium]|nr:transglutaminase family protein [Verrucomicrobiota bacterium]